VLFIQRRPGDGAFVVGLTRFQISDEEVPPRERHPKQLSASRHQMHDPFAGYRDAEIFVVCERLARLRMLHPDAGFSLADRVEAVEVAACISVVALQNVLSPGLDLAHGGERRSDVDRAVVTRGHRVVDTLFTGKEPERIHVSPIRVELEQMGARSRRTPVQEAVASDGERRDSTFTRWDYIDGRMAEDTKIQPELIRGYGARLLGRQWFGYRTREHEQDGDTRADSHDPDPGR
jgi:hypothetical protein